MKKISILIAISLFTICSYAQLSKGGWITSMQGNGSSSKNFNYKSSSLTLQPSVLKLISNNLALGINLNTTFTSGSSPIPSAPETISKLNTFNLEAGPVLRKYFGNYKLKPYAEFGTGWNYTWFNNTIDGKSGNFDDSRFYIKPALGISYWISDRIALDMNLSYDLNQEHYTFQLDDWNMNIGFSVKLGK